MNKNIHSHFSHGLGDAITGHTHPGNIARDGAPKRMHSIAVHDGMTKQTKGGIVATGGDHASALDSLSGLAVVPGAITTAPGYGNSGVQSGHPLAKPPGAKNLRPVATSFGQRSRVNELGTAIKAEALLHKGGDQ